MQTIVYNPKYKYIKNLIIVLLMLATITSTIYIQQQESYANPLVYALAPEALKALAAIFVSVGIMYTGHEAIDNLCNWWFNSAAPVVKEEFLNAVEGIKNGIITLSDELWQSVRDFAQAHFGVGANEVSNTLHVTELDGTAYPYSVNTNEVYPIGGSVTYQGNTYTLEICQEYPDYRLYGLKLNGQWMDGYTSIDSKIGTDIAMYLYAQQYVGLRIMVLKKGLYDSNYVKYYGPAIPGTYDLVKDAILNPTTTISVTGADVLSNPTYDFKDDAGRREVAVPTYVDDLIGKTYTDVQNPALPEAPTETGLLQRILDALTGGMIGFLENIWDWLREFWQKLTEIMSNVLNPVIGAVGDVISAISAKAAEIINAITGVKEAVQEADLTQQTKDYKLPDIFILILKVILACIRLVLRVLVYIASIVAIGADGSLLSENMVSGIDFFKNQVVPVLNVSIWTIFTSLVTLLFGLAVVKRVRRMYSV